MPDPSSSSSVGLAVIRSVIVLALAVGLLVVVNLGGGVVSEAIGLARGGTVNLMWDLAWTVLSGTVSIAFVARLVSFAPRRHALGFVLALAALTIFAVVEMGGDFPVWFSAGLLLGLPLQYWWGVRWALGRGAQAGGLSTT